MIRLVASDIDGTLLLERYPMQCARVEDVLRKLAEG